MVYFPFKFQSAEMMMEAQKFNSFFRATKDTQGSSAFHSASVNDSQIVLMQNYNLVKWKYICMNRENIKKTAKTLMKFAPASADWKEILPQGLSIEQMIDYVLGLICIDFCHWDLMPGFTQGKIRNFYAYDNSGKCIRGSAAMTFLAKQAYEKGVHIFDASFMVSASVDDLRPYFTGMDIEGRAMEIPMLEERVCILNEVGKILITKWKGSFYHLLNQANGHAFNNGSGFVELLIRDFRRFRDEYNYQGQRIGIYKLAQLAVIALQSTLNQFEGFVPFKDYAALTLCADYQLPRSLRALGILEYSQELIDSVDNGKLILPGSPLEIELRMATIYAGELLKQEMNLHLTQKGRKLITSPELDYWLWNHGRGLDNETHRHHLTKTFMY